jgi:hypothetical protein
MIMTAYLRAGDKIVLAVPDVHPGDTLAEDRDYWDGIYEPLGVVIHHLLVMAAITSPVVVTVFRAPPEGVSGEDPS